MEGVVILTQPIFLFLIGGGIFPKHRPMPLADGEGSPPTTSHPDRGRGIFFFQVPSFWVFKHTAATTIVGMKESIDEHRKANQTNSGRPTSTDKEVKD
jgi:hypothetical protein